jgi:hypothetical protein
MPNRDCSWGRQYYRAEMASIFEGIDERLTEFMVTQPVFFVATAPLSADGHVNCSPKGNRGEFAVLGPKTVAYLDQTGSGSETIAHLRENGRIVVMFCAFTGPPRIVRLHGRGECVAFDDERFGALAARFADGDGVGVRSVITITVDRVSDSCGYGVPFMDFVEHRPTMDQWSARKGPAGIRDYWVEQNLESVDGLPSLDRGDLPSQS